MHCDANAHDILNFYCSHPHTLALSCTCLLATINFRASEVARRGLLLPHSLALRELETYSLSFYWRERVVIVWRSHSQHARLTRLVIAAGFIFVRCQGDFLLWFTAEPSYWELWRKMNWIALILIIWLAMSWRWLMALAEKGAWLTHEKMHAPKKYIILHFGVQQFLFRSLVF